VGPPSDGFSLDGETTIAINGDVGNYFRNGRGVRQGDPPSYLLYDFAVEALDAILGAAMAACHISGEVHHLIPRRDGDPCAICRRHDYHDPARGS
jgi:hypothetical protein